MIDFVSYVLFMIIGVVVGVGFGLRFMNWYWSGATVSQKENATYWVALATAVAYFAARRYW